MAIVRQYVMVASAGQGDALRDALAQLSPAVAALPGCEGVELLRDVDAPERFVFIERWTSVDAHKAGAAGLSKELIGAIMAPLAAPLQGAYLAPA